MIIHENTTCMQGIKRSHPLVMKTSGQPNRVLLPPNQILWSDQEAFLTRKHSGWPQSSWWGVMCTQCNGYMCISLCDKSHSFFSVTPRCLSSCRTVPMMSSLAWPPSTREPVAVRAPSTSGTGMTKSSSQTLMEPSPGVQNIYSFTVILN